MYRDVQYHLHISFLKIFQFSRVTGESIAPYVIVVHDYKKMLSLYYTLTIKLFSTEKL